VAHRGAGHRARGDVPALVARRANPLELFQIWLNLPAVDKMVEPHFTMLWRDSIPEARRPRRRGSRTEVTVIAGQLGDDRAPAPPPHSWAHRPDSEVAIWTLKLAPNARFTLPPAARGTNRTLYCFRGSEPARGRPSPSPRVGSCAALPAPRWSTAPTRAELLLLQGKAIGEPVAQHGPFVMNTRAEIQQAFSDYQRTRFGGWPSQVGCVYGHGLPSWRRRKSYVDAPMTMAPTPATNAS
jgi:redox-sensitive bicupin YhaK (pirin superfamily)